MIDSKPVLWNVPEPERAGRPHLVMLHGYGSNESDLFQLTGYLLPELVVASLQAPLPIDHGYSWYPISDGTDSTGVDAAADDLAVWLSDIRARASWLGLLGFSQGGGVGLQALRRHPEIADAMILLSSTRHPQEDPNDAAFTARNVPVFLGLGTQDTVMQPQRLVDTREWLPGHTRLTERIYEGLGHGVSAQMLDDVNTFMRALIPS